MAVDPSEIKKITDLQENAEAQDTDLMIVGNGGTSVLRKITWSNLLNAIRAKILSWKFDELKTKDKTITGGINELSNNSYSLSKINAVVNGDDLNAAKFTVPGIWTCDSASISETLTNVPFTASGFRLIVEYIGATLMLRQTIICQNEKQYIFKRRAYKKDGTWTYENWICNDTTIEELTTSIEKINSDLGSLGGIAYSYRGGIDDSNINNVLTLKRGIYNIGSVSTTPYNLSRYSYVYKCRADDLNGSFLICTQSGSAAGFYYFNSKTQLFTKVVDVS